jgi:hypothetical protein
MRAAGGKVKISKEVLSQEIHGETVLMDLASEQYFGLDVVGTRVWQLLQEGKSREQLLAVMLEEFEVGREQLESDIASLLEKLISAGLISVEHSDEF